MAKVDVCEVRDRFAQLRARTIERYDAVQRLRGQSMGLRTIAKELGIDRKTARRLATASDPEDVIAAATSRAALLDDFVPHLLTSWNAGCTDVAVLTQEALPARLSGQPAHRLPLLAALPRWPEEEPDSRCLGGGAEDPRRDRVNHARSGHSRQR
ncbi:hypothetical protein ACIHDR_48600 [Nocardia sp. NPDC052278]|uniref:hypothetical protein n=1 Tax=Nocardia sp. NPDC052278 TaxID=3364328 RepID=UPI0037CBCE2C